MCHPIVDGSKLCMTQSRSIPSEVVSIELRCLQSRLKMHLGNLSVSRGRSQGRAALLRVTELKTLGGRGSHSS